MSGGRSLGQSRQFRIGFDKRDIPTVLEAWRAILQSESWSEGDYLTQLEKELDEMFARFSAVMSSWTGAALACLSYFNVRGKKVLCPTNTFMATPLAAMHLGGDVIFGDSSRDDLCLSAEAVESGIRQGAEIVIVTHIGGHIAFEIHEIAELCASNGVILIEDCAHALGATWKDRRAGTWGHASLFSLYATKPITTGEGGFLVSHDGDLIDFARQYRNYGKPSYDVLGLNFRMDEFRAALGLAQVRRLEEIVRVKNAYATTVLDPQYPNRVRMPEGMRSNYYKYVVFEDIVNSTGRVYDTPCHVILGRREQHPNAEWIARNHSCVPIYYEPPTLS